MFPHGLAITAMLDREQLMNNIIWLVGVVVIVLVILGYLGFR
jgi:hypothetical protein